MLGNKIIFFLPQIIPYMNITGINQKRLYEIRQGLSGETSPHKRNSFVFIHHAIVTLLYK